MSSANFAMAAEADKCGFVMPDKKEFKGEITKVDNQKITVERGKVFKVKFYLKNTGNVPWTRLENECGWPVMSLKTSAPKYSKNPLYVDGIKFNLDNLTAIMVKMNKSKTLPGETATFSLFLKAAETDNAFKIFYTPEIINSTEIIDLKDLKTAIEVTVGKPEKDLKFLGDRFYLTGVTGSVMDFNPSGEKKITIDLSEQKLTATIDKKIIREFSVSTGASKTPTPTGKYKVLTKNISRMSYEKPHYIMPNFMMIKEGGLGIHALPSLHGQTGDILWTEAREHIGQRVSHGRIRLLPEDSNFIYTFGDIGVPVIVQW